MSTPVPIDPSLTEKRTTLESGAVHIRKQQVPIPDWAETQWPNILRAVKIKPDLAALAKVIEGIRAEQRIITAQSRFSMQAASADFEQRLEAYVKGVHSGEIPPEQLFTDTRQQVELEHRATRDALNEVVARVIADTRPHAKKLLQSILTPIAEARSEIQEQEKAEAIKWGGVFDPSHQLLVLVSAEVTLQRAVSQIDDAPKGNYTRSMIRRLLPPGMID